MFVLTYQREVDDADAIVVRDGMAVNDAFNVITVIFDHDNVDQAIGDQSYQDAKA